MSRSSTSLSPIIFVLGLAAGVGFLAPLIAVPAEDRVASPGYLPTLTDQLTIGPLLDQMAMTII